MLFNGKNGCRYCTQGETYHLDTGGQCHMFPYNKDLPDGPLEFPQLCLYTLVRKEAGPHQGSL